MKSANGADGRPSMCLLFHNFINRLSVIVGNCELVVDEAEKAGIADLPHMRRIPVVRNIAVELARELREQMSELDAVTKTMLVGEKAKGLASRGVNQDAVPASTSTSRG